LLPVDNTWSLQTVSALSAEVDAFKYAFLLRTIPACNALLHEVIDADSLDLFK